MWKLLITKAFFKQFLKLAKDKQSFILDSLNFLLKTLNLDSEPDIDIIDEYDEKGKQPKPFPITYHVDYDKKRVYLICIEEKVLQNNNHGSHSSTSHSSGSHTTHKK